MSRIHADLILSTFPGGAPQGRVTALVDTGSAFLALPEDALVRFGAVKVDERTVRLADETRRVCAMYGGLLVEIPDFGKMTSLILALPEGAEAVIGHTALEEMGIAVDFSGHRLLKVDADLKAVEAIKKTRAQWGHIRMVEDLLWFVENSERGICR